LQSQISVLTKKVADLEKAFAQSAAKTVFSETKITQKPASKEVSSKKSANNKT